jgi:hypothetical protein
MPTAREETTRLADLLSREHHALADFLVALAAFDRERRWVDLGHRSLFYFLHRELGLPKGPAYYRKTAAELIQKYPELVEPLRDGRLHLTSIVELSNVITPENREDVIPRFFHTSKREAKEVSAALLPMEAPPLRTVVTAVIPRASSAAGTPAADPASASLPPVLPEEPPRPAPSGEAPPARPPTVEPLTADLRRIHLTVSRRLLDKLTAAGDALSHSHPGASEEQIFEVGLDLILERFAKRRGIGAKPRKPRSAPDGSPTGAQPPPPSKRSRHVPAAVWRAVWKRDGGCCAWPLEGGGVCGSTIRVELDHIDGFALGAGTTVEECRLLCDFHQDVSARQLYGDDLMNNYTRPKGPRCSEPVAVYGGGRRGRFLDGIPAGDIVGPWPSNPPSTSSSPTCASRRGSRRTASRPTAATSGATRSTSRRSGSRTGPRSAAPRCRPTSPS